MFIKSITNLRNYSVIANRHSPSYNDRMVAMAFSCDWLFFHAVSAMECMAKKASAPTSDLNVPDIFCLTFSFLIPLSLALSNSCDNASERGIRKVKIKMKNSGTFRSDKGADAFLDLLSIVETTKKHNNSPYAAIRALF